MRGFLWPARTMPRYRATVASLGPLRAHLACVAISLHNDCAIPDGAMDPIDKDADVRQRQDTARAAADDTADGISSPRS